MSLFPRMMPVSCQWFSDVICGLVIVLSSCFAGEQDELELLRTYRQDPAGNPHLPPVFSAGYRGSHAPTIVISQPEDEAQTATLISDDLHRIIEIVQVTEPPKEGLADALLANALQLARAKIDAGTTGVMVRLAPGRYVLSRPLFIDRDGLILAGAGRDRTMLHFEQSLTQAIALQDGAERQWSWRGGFIWVAANPLGLSDGPFDLLSLHTPIKAGDRSITISDAQTDALTQLIPGTPLVIASALSHPSLEMIFGGPLELDRVGGFDDFVTPQGIRFEFVTICREINGRTILLDHAVPVSYAKDDVVQIGPAIGYGRENGISDLTVSFPEHYNGKKGGKGSGYSHLCEPGFNAIFIEGALDCWVKNVCSINADTTVALERTYGGTLSGLLMEGASEHIAHHGVTLRAYCSRLLLEDFEIRSRIWHGISAQDMANTSVIRNGDLHHGTLDCHRGMPFDLVRTNIRLRNCDGRGGGAIGPFCGRRVVSWNLWFDPEGRHSQRGLGVIVNPCQYSMGVLAGIVGMEVAPSDDRLWAMPPGDKGTVVFGGGAPVEPRDLYEWQRTRRPAGP